MDFKSFIIYVVDTETTGLDPNSNEIIEASFYRINDDAQKTWFMKPNKYDIISQDALRVNGHKMEDLKLLTKFGQDTYQDPSKVIVEIENWMMDDLAASEDRILIGQNIGFDLGFLKNLWKNNGSVETFPFGKIPFALDTIQLDLFFDLVNGERSQYRNLESLVHKYGVKKEKTHRAASDTRMTKDVFLAMLKKAQSSLSK